MSPTDAVEPTAITLAIAIASGLLLLGFALSLFRLWRGPSTADRVVALDLIAYHVIGVSALLALRARNIGLLAPALVLALLAFLATVAFARELERRAKR
jgi:multicomponent Na+:H+ antiporter subunit F